MAGLVPATHDLRVEKGASAPPPLLWDRCVWVAGTSLAMTFKGEGNER
jgi:hypothetical protein